MVQKQGLYCSSSKTYDSAMSVETTQNIFAEGLLVLYAVQNKTS